MEQVHVWALRVGLFVVMMIPVMYAPGLFRTSTREEFVVALAVGVFVLGFLGLPVLFIYGLFSGQFR